MRINNNNEAFVGWLAAQTKLNESMKKMWNIFSVLFKIGLQRK